MAEFARMTPQELLVATEKAAGNEHLLEWHTSLIETGQTLKKLNTVNRKLPLSFDFNSENVYFLGACNGA